MASLNDQTSKCGQLSGVEIAARYGLPPNLLHYCGKPSFIDVMKVHVAGDRSKQILAKMKKELMDFKAHYAYLSLIARENDLAPLDSRVVRAFWTGNELLDSVSDEALRRFIVNDLFPFRQRKRAQRLADTLPSGLVPHHSFNPLYINFISETVGKGIENLDACCITPAKVLSISADAKTAFVMRDSIVRSNGGRFERFEQFAIKKKRSTIRLEKSGFSFLAASDLSAGDVLSVHWGLGIERLGARAVRKLLHYTKKNIRAINFAGSL